MGEAPKAASGRRDALKELRDRGGVKALGQVLSECALAGTSSHRIPTCVRPDISCTHCMWIIRLGLGRVGKERGCPRQTPIPVCNLTQTMVLMQVGERHGCAQKQSAAPEQIVKRCEVREACGTALLAR